MQTHLRMQSQPPMYAAIHSCVDTGTQRARTASESYNWLSAGETQDVIASDLLQTPDHYTLR